MKRELIISDFSREEIERSHEIFLKRNAVYRGHGVDQEELRRSIARLAGPAGSSVLEIGTGRGYLTSILAETSSRIVTVDLQSDDKRTAMLHAAYYKRLENIEFVNADAADLTFPSRSFDIVVSAFTFHHLDLPFKVLREMARVADKQIIISDFNESGFEAVEKVHMSEGGNHERKPGDFSIVGIYLKEFNFDVTVIEEEWQTIYSARRR